MCLCYRCNKLQGTDSWATFLKKQGVQDPKVKLRESLQKLNIRQLQTLADKHSVQVKGQIVEGYYKNYRKAPTKSQYVNKLAGIVTEKEISSLPKETPKAVKRKR